MSVFIFKKYSFDSQLATASFRYGYDDGTEYEERVTFDRVENYDAQLLDRALFLSFILAGTSYFKTFPTPNISFEAGGLDQAVRHHPAGHIQWLPLRFRTYFPHWKP